MKMIAALVAITLTASPAIDSATATELRSESSQTSNPQIDYPGFLKLTGEIAKYREARLVTLEAFNKISLKTDAIILDTRSAAAFRQGHIEGAINLPFSDFTAEKLAEYLGDQDRPILIYCNNNFRNDIAPVVRKAAPLALNIPTFINLYGYGYQNIYELNDVISMTDPRIRWVSDSL
ncbi:Rhodanese-like domain protein [hydrothermal vent metagenome]|uniref:Rhodanese-like domain protein n=1 Tax=hydrothermal vent metagenome TaxID=652676 RepID=A0A3B0SXZ0_9ZZZZ